MKESENVESSVVQETLAWLSWLFRVPVETLDFSKKFGTDLKPSAESFFGKETFDVVAEDVTDLEKFFRIELLGKGSAFTVGDFCGLVARLNNADPVGCRRMLKSWNRIMMFDKKPKWRRFLFKTFGF
jgi:hypothetical protein